MKRALTSTKKFQPKPYTLQINTTTLFPFEIGHFMQIRNNFLPIWALHSILSHKGLLNRWALSQAGLQLADVMEKQRKNGTLRLFDWITFEEAITWANYTWSSFRRIDSVCYALLFLGDRVGMKEVGNVVDVETGLQCDVIDT
ncbi:hypothetical protein JTE90_012768 [Oedothorax gibbosus]|uniref:Uncharacterized protein n=1 Tax=Oedothorax gibbosus TaxID=931172 RepID=A0AAV6VYA0_9ARAC|nr:hypothetical protein JTE90_012768 [Oedothorax gibbosus]